MLYGVVAVGATNGLVGSDGLVHVLCKQVSWVAVLGNTPAFRLHILPVFTSVVLEQEGFELGFNRLGSRRSKFWKSRPKSAPVLIFWGSQGYFLGLGGTVRFVIGPAWRVRLFIQFKKKCPAFAISKSLGSEGGKSTGIPDREGGIGAEGGWSGGGCQRFRYLLALHFTGLLLLQEEKSFCTLSSMISNTQQRQMNWKHLEMPQGVWYKLSWIQLTDCGKKLIRVLLKKPLLCSLVAGEVQRILPSFGGNALSPLFVVLALF